MRGLFCIRGILLFVMWVASQLLIAQWISQPNFPGEARDDASIFSIQGKLYAGFGRDIGFQVRNDFWEFTPETSQWRYLGDAPPPPRQYALHFSDGNKGYLLGGLNPLGNALSDFWVFDGNTWLELPAAPRSMAMGVLFIAEDKKGLIAGLGRSNNGLCSDSLHYFDFESREWTFWSQVPGGGRCLPMCVVTYNAIICGLGNDNQSLIKSDTWQYGWKEKTWKPYYLPQDFSPAKHFLMWNSSIDKALVGFGETATGEILNTVWLYNGTTNTWTQTLANAPYRRGASWAMLQDELHLIWGLNENLERQNTHLVHKIDLRTSIKVFPNPSYEVLHVFFSDWDGEDHPFEIWDILGKRIMTIDLKKDQLNTLEIFSLRQGVYFLRNPNQNFVLKFVKVGR